MLMFVVGVFVGAAAGVVIACLAVAASEDDREGREEN